MPQARSPRAPEIKEPASAFAQSNSCPGLRLVQGGFARRVGGPDRLWWSELGVKYQSSSCVGAASTPQHWVGTATLPQSWFVRRSSKVYVGRQAPRHQPGDALPFGRAQSSVMYLHWTPASLPNFCPARRSRRVAGGRRGAGETLVCTPLCLSGSIRPQKILALSPAILVRLWRQAVRTSRTINTAECPCSRRGVPRGARRSSGGVSRNLMQRSVRARSFQEVMLPVAVSGAQDAVHVRPRRIGEVVLPTCLHQWSGQPGVWHRVLMGGRTGHMSPRASRAREQRQCGEYRTRAWRSGVAASVTCCRARHGGAPSWRPFGGKQARPAQRTHRVPREGTRGRKAPGTSRRSCTTRSALRMVLPCAAPHGGCRRHGLRRRDHARLCRRRAAHPACIRERGKGRGWFGVEDSIWSSGLA